jgi:type IV secretory pathway TrbD component
MAGTPTFRSLTQPLLVAGGERVPAALVCGGALLAGVVAWFSFDLTNPLRPGPLCVAGVALFLMTAGLGFLRVMAKRDPLMFEVAQRYYAFKKFYPARTAVRFKGGR